MGAQMDKSDDLGQRPLLLIVEMTKLIMAAL